MIKLLEYQHQKGLKTRFVENNLYLMSYLLSVKDEISITDLA